MLSDTPAASCEGAATPSFSVATPTFDALKKLKRCVGSVRGQRNVTLEHLIQDAASKDGTPQWLSRQRDVLSVSEPDGGMYDAINRAWARSRGAYLSWLNADEQYLPGTLATVQAFFESDPDADVVFGDYIVADDHGRPIALRREIPFRRIYTVNGYAYAQSCTLFYRRRLYDQGLLHLDARYRYAADKDLLLRLADAGCVIKHIPRYLAVFGIDGSNLSTHARAEQESEQIRRTYGAFRLRAMRKAVVAGRRLERLLSGAYRSEAITFHFATDDAPNYLEMSTSHVGGRYSLADTVGRADSARPVRSQ